MFNRLVRKAKNRCTKIDNPAKPVSYHQLQVLVRKNGMRCRCELCEPSSYRFHCFYQFSHQKFKLHERLEVNKYGHACYMRPMLRADSSSKPEMMHLARSIVEYFDRPWEYMNDEQLEAREMLLKWLASRRDTLQTR
jgi:hypothetical protein